MDTDSTTHNNKYMLGLARLAEIDPRAGDEIVEPLGALGRYIMEFAYGDIYNRPGLSSRDRALLTIGMLTALGGHSLPLKVHLAGALRLGLTAPEIEEIIIHSVLYAGFPNAIDAQRLLLEVLAEQKAETQTE